MAFVVHTTGTIRCPQLRNLRRSTTRIAATAGAGRLQFRFGFHNIPHPDKADYGGEDALFVSEETGSAGVADGVGGWNGDGINPAEYSADLMQFAQMYMEGTLPTPPSAPTPTDTETNTEETSSTIAGQANETPFQSATATTTTAASADPQPTGPRTAYGALAVAHQYTRKPGSATACVLRFDATSGTLDGANLGDSGFFIIRNSKVVFQSPIQQHFFDCPYQFGAAPEFVPDTDTADDADLFNIALHPGDVVVLGTDGLLDNVWPSDIALLAPRSATQARSAARELAELASVQAADQTYESPYSVALAEAEGEIPIWEKFDPTAIFKGMGLNSSKPRGGKMDDITVVVAYVEKGELWEKEPAAPGTPAAVEGEIARDY